MKTGTFRTYKGKNSISIAIYPPLTYTGDKFPDLYPDRKTFFSKKADEIDEKQYEEQYRERVLSKLNPQEIYDMLNGKVLLCWEPPGEFCHRRIVASWIQENLGIEVPEWKQGDDDIKDLTKPLF
jgi:hypothetical protein